MSILQISRFFALFPTFFSLFIFNFFFFSLLFFLTQALLHFLFFLTYKY